MAEWNLTLQQETQLESIARDEALLSQEAHAYLPTNPEEAAHFDPHEWVMEAMRRAFSAGRTTGQEDAKREMRDHFAGLALQGLCANPAGPFQESPSSGWALTNCNEDNVAGTAYAMADAMLRAREGAPSNPPAPHQETKQWRDGVR